ncbi:MAG: hypothetical protein K0R29_2722, partial [Pseudobdellovibrio sp.]|nr:hypothetical protein [Pseudobdellovibrio sp.]
MIKHLAFLLLTLNSLAAVAGIQPKLSKAELIEKYRHEPTKEELHRVLNAPLSADSDLGGKAVDWRPAPEISDYKFVLLSSEAGFSEAANLRYTIAKNLPEGVKLVLLVSNSNAERVKQVYSQYISPDRLILAKDTSIEGGFWARDSFPYPVVNGQGQLSLVGAKYYRTFRSSPAVAASLGLNMVRPNFTFVGGNLMADENGVCFTIDSYRKFTTTENDLLNVYGCKTVHVLKRYSGIGDVDEVVKTMGNNVILTNTPEYVNDFKSWGYTVVMMPAVPNSYRTYVNSLVVGKTVFMPTYGISTDAQAKKVYEDLGYTVVGIPSNTLSDDMHGSVHCQTMAYPAINEQ